MTAGSDVSLTWPQLLVLLGVPWSAVTAAIVGIIAGKLVPLSSIRFKDEQIVELKADNRELRGALRDQTGKVSGMVGQLGAAAARVRTEEPQQHPPPTTEVV